MGIMVTRIPAWQGEDHVQGIRVSVGGNTPQTQRVQQPSPSFRLTQKLDSFAGMGFNGLAPIQEGHRLNMPTLRQSCIKGSTRRCMRSILIKVKRRLGIAVFCLEESIIVNPVSDSSQSFRVDKRFCDISAIITDSLAELRQL
jgi:hypothetical protein